VEIKSGNNEAIALICSDNYENFN